MARAALQELWALVEDADDRERRTQGIKYPYCSLFLFWKHFLVSIIGWVQPEVREQGCLLMQPRHINLPGHREGGEGEG